MNKVDLHTHTTASDGKNSPSENVNLAHRRGLKAIAITDHDTVSGIEEAREKGQETGVEVIPGIEVSTLFQGQDVHVLGYFIDYQNSAFQDELAKLRETRQVRNLMMIERLNKLGIPITLEEVSQKQTNPAGNVGRPHMAEVLMDKGIVESMEEAFKQYLGKEGKAYVNPPRISPAEGIRLIRRYGGVPVLAHPGLYGLDESIEEFVQAGLLGIEVYHPDHSEAEVQRYEGLAKKLGLAVTGGSDYHGMRNGQVFHGDLGSQPVSYDMVDKIKSIKSSLSEND